VEVTAPVFRLSLSILLSGIVVLQRGDAGCQGCDEGLLLLDGFKQMWGKFAVVKLPNIFICFAFSNYARQYRFKFLSNKAIILVYLTLSPIKLTNFNLQQLI